MNYQEMLKHAANNHCISYFRMPVFHRELFGTKPCNLFQLMWLVGSESNMTHYEKAEIPERYISQIPLGRFLGAGKRPMELTEARIREGYPWLELAKSIKEEGFRVPVIAEMQTDGYLALEGRHRVAACSLIEPFDLNFLVHAIVVVRDPFYTTKMFRKPHPDPLDSTGFKIYHNR